MGQDLLNHRKGRQIHIADADSFFSQLVGKVEALRAMNRAHPESIALIVAEGRRFCREERLSADWSDLLAREVARFVSYVAGSDYPADRPTDDSLNALIGTITARSEALRRLVLVGVRWGSDEAFRITLRAISGLTCPNMNQSGFTSLISLRKLGVSMCFQWAIAAALLREDYDRVARIMHLGLRSQNEKNVPAVLLLPLLTLESVQWKVLKGFERHHTPHSDFFSALFVAEARDITVGPDEADLAWDDAEFMIAMESAHLRLSRQKKEEGLWFWIPVGRFIWRRTGTPLSERLTRIRELDPSSVELCAGLIGGTPEAAKDAATAASEFFGSVAGRWLQYQPAPPHSFASPGQIVPPS
jgi:hypothetical protein